MDTETLKTVGQIAGIGGLSIGLILLIFRDVIRRNIFPNLSRQQGYSLLRMIIILTWSIALVGILAWVYVEAKHHSNPQPNTSLNFPGGSGWLLLGDYDDGRGIFVRGPFFEVTKTNYPDKSKLPRKGEWIKLTAEREVIIPDYRISGTSKLDMPPWKKNVLDNNDYTGIKLPAGTEVEMRDVSLGHFEGMPFVVWARVAPIPK
jgi:hypothetical protein